ncbi:MAG: cell division protein ZapA [Pyrinomonadaceae bacterium]
MTLTTAVSVNIYNQPFNLRAHGDGEYVRRIAEYVDRRMQEISAQTNVLDYGKLAVLAALNIADELHRARQADEEQEQQIDAPAAPPPHDDARLPTDAHGTTEASAGSAAEPTTSRAGWSYADIFEELPERKDAGERISQQVASKLRQYRSYDNAGARQSTDGEEGHE